MERIEELIKAIKATLSKLGFYTNYNDDGYQEYDYTLLKRDKTGLEDPEGDEVIARIWMSSNDLEYCCGINELGDLDIKPLLRKNTNKNTAKVRRLFIQWVFLTIKLHAYSLKQGKDKIPKAKQVLFASNGKGPCEEVEQALGGIAKEFWNVSTTRNPSTNSIIKLFVAILIL